MNYKHMPPQSDFIPKIQFENGAILSTEMIMDFRYFLRKEVNALDLKLMNDYFSEDNKLSEAQMEALEFIFIPNNYATYTKYILTVL